MKFKKGSTFKHSSNLTNIGSNYDEVIQLPKEIQTYIDAPNDMCGCDATYFRNDKSVDTIEDCITQNLRMTLFLKTKGLIEEYKKYNTEYEKLFYLEDCEENEVYKGKILKFTGYIVDPNGEWNSSYVEDFLSGADVIVKHINVEERPINDWTDEHPLNRCDCPKEECEKYFSKEDRK